jgi:osomolarity two-component system, response regulator SSK1
MPTPPAPNEHKPSLTPPNRVQSPHPGQRPKKKKGLSARSANGDPAPPVKPASASLLDGTVPPINVLLVEDNVINLKLLEAFMKRLKVRWKSAMNGKEAVAMWRTGGFHLVLMDIQLPVMNGLDATREIRRLEALNGIGVFSGSPLEGGQKNGALNGEVAGEEDKLTDRSLFKSPVIIVALTASSLQSDRHEALAAGCNDFLTKVRLLSTISMPS